jgi:crotonobetainyl-CoA:carnitine CoA-transferase CaiB-like acyl-CoA transferase
VFGVAAALYRRDVLGGEGARIDLALYEPLMRMLDCQLALHATGGKPPERAGSNDPYSFGISCPGRPVFACVESTSGDWFLTMLRDAKSAALLKAILTTGLEDWCTGKTTTELETAFKALAIQYVPIFDGMTIANSPYFQARGDVIATDHPALGRITASGRLDGSRGEPIFRAPGLGEDNAAVFGRLLGMDAAELERLTDAGVI